MKKLVLCFSLFIGSNSFAQDTLIDYLDNSFGGCGYITVDQRLYDNPQKIALQPDGKILMIGTAGNSGVAEVGGVYRFLPNGSADSTWGINGKIEINYGPNGNFPCAITLQNDNKVLLGTIPGSNGFPSHIQRFTENGIPDSSFANNSVLVLQPLPNTIRISPINFLIQSNNDILVNGVLCKGVGIVEQMFIKIKPDGTIDDTYGINGIVRNPDVGSPYYNYNSIACSNGKTLVHGRTNASAFIARYNADGSIDASFGQNGYFTIQTLGTASDGLVGGILADSSIILAGALYGCDTSFVFSTHVDPSGNLISSYGNNGVAYLHASACSMAGGVVYPTGEVITLTQGINGYNGMIPITNIVLTKISSAGIIDTSFMMNGIYESDIPNGSEIPKNILLQNDGKILVSSSYEDYTTPDIYNIDYCIRRFWETADTLVLPIDTTTNPPVDTTIINPTGINYSENNSFSVFPNPVTNQINIIRPYNNNKALTHTLYTKQGQLVQQAIIPNASGTISINIPTELPAGIYYLNLMDSSTNYTIKFIKQ